MVEVDSSIFAQDYLADLKAALDLLDLGQIHAFSAAVEGVMDNGGTVHFIGNGGSAGTPSHSAGDWSKELTLPTLCHVDNVSGLTAWANDTDYDNVFVGALKTFLKVGDIVVGYSGSGNSANVLNGLQYAKDMGCTTIGVGGDYNGGGGGLMAGLVDIAIIARTHSMERIEDIQLIINHIVKETIKAKRGITGHC
ncbi:MAG: SIS domain-containing protein [Candidatus Poseidoniia archaeon]|jgi:D-sedoheptulose 7-phosphate isomerase|nr:MAG: phosphoheptose isomerase [Euryarchaeota archaeon]